MAYAATILYPSPTNNDAHPVHGNQRVKRVSLAHSGTYATGGEVLTASSFGLQRIDFITGAQVSAPTVAAAVTGAVYVPSTGSLKLTTATAELANLVSLTALVTEITVYGQ
jgi:hypothetical protein